MMEKIFANGISFEQFLENIQFKIANWEELGVDEKNLNYLKLNLQRMERILKNETIDEKLLNVVSSIKHPIILMVLTEDWCGDSAQSLPYFYLSTKGNKNIVMKILSRDQNPDIMDKYLTNGSRSIPIIVAFDEGMSEISKWGPRPKKLAEEVDKWKREGLDKDSIIQKIHLWYAKDKGAEIKKEIEDFFQNIANEKYQVKV